MKVHPACRVKYVKRRRYNDAMSVHAFGLTAILLALAGPDAASLLKERGLERQATTWILPAEADLGRALHKVGTFDRVVKKARKADARMARNLKGLDREIESLTKRRRQISNQLPQLARRDARLHNQAIATLNQISIRLAELYEYKVSSDEPARIETELAAARQSYIQHLLDTRRAVDEVLGTYDELSSDAQVTEAIAELGRAQQESFTLGPSRRYLGYVKRLERFEASVHTEQIALRRQAGTYWVTVVFNRKVTRELLFDSGASTISLPASMAAEIGLAPSSADTTTRVSLADGSVVEASVRTIPFVRVGSFEARDVRCIVLPPEFTNAPALLGGSFINRFGYTIDTGAGMLTLHRLDD